MCQKNIIFEIKTNYVLLQLSNSSFSPKNSTLTKVKRLVQNTMEKRKKCQKKIEIKSYYVQCTCTTNDYTYVGTTK